MSLPSRRRLRIVRTTAWGVVALCLAFVATLVLLDVTSTDEAEGASLAREIPAILTIGHDGYLYTYHVVTGAEALFDVTRDSELLDNLLSDHPQLGHRLRGMLEDREEVEDLRQFQESFQDEIDGLRALGYL